MIYQTINGKRANIAHIDISAVSFFSLANLLAVEVQYLSRMVNTDDLVDIVKPNPIVITVSKRFATGMRYSENVRLAHVDPLKNFSEISNRILGVWNASFSHDIKCEKMVINSGSVTKGGL